MSTAIKPPKGTLSAVQAARRAAQPQVLADRRPMGDLDLGRMLLRGKTISADLRGIIVDAELERTIEAASTLTLTVHDRERLLLKSGVLHRGATITVNGLTFALVRPEKHGDEFSLTFEDLAIWALRQRDEPLKVRRTKEMTRARFIERLVREVKTPRISLWSPERDVVQEIAKSDASGTPEPYEFSRGTVAAEGVEAEKEDSWSAIRRLADEVQWRAFIVADVLYYGTDQAILKQAPRYTIRERTAGIETIDWTLDEGLKAQSCTLTCLAERWAAPPGTVVRLAGQGPADGLWIVQSMRRRLSSVQASVELTRPREPLPEPAPGTRAETPSLDPLAAVNGEAPASVQRAYRRASEIHGYRQGYAWGGGHGNINGNGPFDCSGGVSNVMGPRGGGFISATMATPGWNTWGQAGEGQYLTVWVRETGVPERSHMFLEFKGFPNRWWEAGGIRGALTGWRSEKSTVGFTPRHHPGT